MRRIISSLIAVLIVAPLQSQTTLKETPKLVIGITIDQLRGDYIKLFQHTFTERGFKRLLNEGLVYQNMNFDFPNLNPASAIATIYTGTSPFYHGIISEKKYSSTLNSEVSIFADNFLGNYTSEKLSPNALRVSTITDELKIASQGASDVYSFAPNAEEALAAGGHAANTSFWIENLSGKWATTTYFKNFHWSVEQENKVGIYSNQIAQLSWVPLLPVATYNSFPYTINHAPFVHKFDTNDAFKLMKKSPFGNDDVCNTALTLIDKAALGTRTTPDFVSLCLYAGDYPQSTDNYSIEIQDTYARLDKNIEKILDEIDRKVGLKNTLIFVTSTGYYDVEDIYSDQVKLPNSIFYSNRCESLLNMYLMAIYGKEQWVDKFYDSQMYLNRKLIEKKNINLEEIQNKAAEFISQFTGVQDVATSIQLLTGRAGANMTQYKNSFDKKTSGDIFVEIQPGYKIVNEQNTKLSDKTEKRVRQSAVACPVIFFGYGLKPERIKRTIKAEEIAPTVSYILRIRSPNATKATVLPEFL